MSDSAQSDGQGRGYLIDDPRYYKATVEDSLTRIPHSAVLGLEIVSIERDVAILRLPYSDRLIGNPVSRTVHGGAVLSLVDSASGKAVFCAVPAPETIATLDLRIDYLKPPQPEQDLFCRAECYKLTRSVAFVRAEVYHQPGDPIAHSVSTFMRSSSSIANSTMEPSR
ncbi:MAG: PaaI family thioesterase [Pseudomonadales bacterium]|jgi:uncharacterized protein (TIGR00369 family)|nr:PaaI family thioesterase [Pseudomonadales bacterium]MCP5333918.1 PaaI family thioesterase [Pseudomonadales bacterium]HMU89591.1 PaaI family thioesterase [Pseudomonadales bacterium]HMW15149.1 PaaI family thioesterase [Pseudomonadales bacterium]HMW82584.1 PaaI family thioesterase [Pseudomonadales bacterium]